MFDLLSTSLETVRMRSLVFPRSELTAPWGIRFPRSIDEVPAHFRPPVDDIPKPLQHRLPFPGGGFYAVTRGNCILETEDSKEPINLTGGDLVVFLRPAGHIIRDAPTSAVKPIWEVHKPLHLPNPTGIFAGGGGAITTLISGLYMFDNHLDNRLLSALPSAMHVKAETGQSTPWLEDTLRFLNYETSELAPGWMSVINRLAQVLFIQAVRAYVRSAPAGHGNWLHALLDPEIGPVLGFMHQTPEAPWTVESLAEVIPMSRSAFAARFVEMVGEPPLQYLTQCRMQKAADLLTDGQKAIKEVAATVGYESVASFSKAFKRTLGFSPGSYRNQQTGPVRA